MLNKVEEELCSTSDVAKADDIELQEIMENVARSMENPIEQLEGESSEELPMHEPLSLYFDFDISNSKVNLNKL